MRGHIFLGYVLLIGLTQCQSNKGAHKTPSRSYTGNIESKTPDVVHTEKYQEKYLRSVREVRENKSLSLTEEYESFQKALQDYTRSEAFIHPSNDPEKVRKLLVEAMSHLSLEQIKDFMKKGKFAKARHRIETQLPELQKTTDEILKIKREPSTELQLVEGKTEVQQNTGIALVVLGSMGILTITGALGYVAGPVGGLLGAGLGTLLFAWPLTYGALIVADDNPSRSTISEVQYEIFSEGVLAGVAALAIGADGVETLYHSWKTPSSNVSKNLEGRSRVGAGTHNDAELEAPRKMEGDFIADSKRGLSDETTKGLGMLGVGVLAAGISAGLIVWSVELDMAESSMSPQDLLYSKVERALIAFETIETQKNF